MKPRKTTHMQTAKIVFTCLFLGMALSSCLDNSTDSKPIIEPSGSADYYINNQTSIALNLIYRISGNSADSSKTIPKESSTKFFRDGIFGANPSPSRSLDKIVFYKGSSNSSELILTIKPIKDDQWNITEEKGFEESEYGFRKYELTITTEDLQ
tara:strand:+ start:182 stop:643 length:462 start_codon:yes stop_codon:yes gene_type:complete